MRIVFIVLPIIEAGLILFLVLGKSSPRRPGTALKVFGFAAIGAGIVWILRSHLNFGWFGPLSFLRIWLDAFGHHGNTNFWGLFNPLMYGGIFALGLMAGGAGLLRVQSWARTLLLYLAAGGAILAMITLIKFSSRMNDSLRAITFLHVVAALGIVLFFTQKSITQLFTGEAVERDSPQKNKQ